MIKTALTAEEWAAKCADRGWEGWPYGGTVRVTEHGVVLEDEYSGIHNGLRHAVAALCLHGQPFGFTWEDVHALRAASSLAAPYSAHDDDFVIKERGGPHVPGKLGWYAVLTLGDLRKMVDLADRIAALLPPEAT